MHSIPQSHHTTSTRASGRRRGSVLVEFAMVSFVLYLLTVVLLDWSRASMAAQTLQGAASLMAKELARAPIEGTCSFEGVLYDNCSGSAYVRSRIYDEQHLVIELTAGLSTPEEISAHFAGLPIVNQMLRPLMFFDEVKIGGADVPLFRYPGAVVKRPDGEYTVLIPYILERDYYDNQGDAERVSLRRVVEEVKAAEGDPSHFPINSPSDLRGVVSLRLNYPYQAVSMSAFDSSQPEPTGPYAKALASDANVQQEGSTPGGYTLEVDGDTGIGPNAGRYGLGAHYTLIAPGEQLARPFRRLISVQAIQRREVIFGP